MSHLRAIRLALGRGAIESSRVLAVVGGLAVSPAVAAQMGELAPVAVDDSPVAERLLSEVAAQSADNPERAAALLGELLDQYATRVVVDGDDPDAFRSVRGVVLDVLAGDGAIRQAWRDRFEVDAARLLEVDGAEACLLRRPMTDAGLEAGLRIAQATIESGDPGSGRRLLESLRSWPGATGAVISDRIAVLDALAAIAIAGEDPIASKIESRDAAIDSVRRHDPALAARLDAIADASMRTGPASPASPFGRDWTALWEVPLEVSLHRQRTVDLATGRALHPDPESVRLDGRYLVSLPAVSGDLVLINEGRLLEGFDRYTGRLRWYRDRGIGRFVGSGIPGDLCEIVVVDDDAYTITGYAMTDGRGAERSIVRFDPASGREHWEVRVDRLPDHPELEDAAPCGPPMVIGDLVMVPLRSTTPRLETIDHVVALDRRDGDVRWVRSIASSGSTRAGNARPTSRLAALDGDVLVASPAGAVARLDGRTGEVVWLHREEVPLRADGRVSLAWQIGGPVVLDRGIATLDAARRNWQLLDPATGEVELRRPIGTGTAAGAAGWLAVAEGALDGRDLLLAIGDDVVAIDPAAPDAPVWSWRRAAESSGIEFETAVSRIVRGRVFVDRDTLLVPTSGGVFAVDPRDGRSARVLDFDGPVNPVLTADAIHAAGPDALMTAMPVLEAVATLESRLRAQPDAVPQAMALVELAARIGRPELLRFAAAAAVDGLSTPEGEAWRSEVLDLLLERVPGASDDEGFALLELAARAASTDVAGRARHRLAEAAWFEGNGRPREAAEAWLGVMGDGEASTVMIRMGEALEVSAGSVARRRLVAALRRDPSLRRRLEVEAMSEVESAIADRETAAVLVDLARRWPGTDAAIAAASRAIEILRDEGDSASVLAVGLVTARDFDAADARRRTLLEQAAVACEESGASGRAAVLRRLVADGVADVARRPRLDGVPDHLESIQARLVPMDPRSEAEAPPDLVLLFDPNRRELVALDALELKERWRRPADGELVVVGWRPEILVWEGVQRREPVLTALDPATGEVRWSTPQPSRLLPPLSRFAVQADGFLPGGEVFLPYQVLPLPLAEGVLLVRRDGVASLVDRIDGRTVLWSRRELPERVYGVTTGGGLVHVHGAGIGEGGEKVGLVVSIDPVTGNTVSTVRVPVGEIQWLVAGDLGQVAVGTRSEVRLIDPVGGILGTGDRWTRRDGGLGGGIVGWMSDTDLAIADDSGRISVWDLAGGLAVDDRWLLPDEVGGLAGRAIESIDLGDCRALHLDGRLVLHGADGRLLGADALLAPSRRDWSVVPVEGGLLLVTRLAVGPGATTIRVQRLDPSAGLRLVGSPFELAGRTRYDAIRAVDGHLLLSTEVETHVLPMSPRRDEAPDSPAGP